MTEGKRKGRGIMKKALLFTNFSTTCKLLAGVAICSFLVSTAKANFVEGFVFCTDSAGCPAIATTPVAGVVVTAQGTVPAHFGQATTAADGSYHIDLLAEVDDYTVSIAVAAPLSVVCPANGMIAFHLDPNVNDGQFSGENFYVTGCSSPPPPPQCCPPPNPFFGLGAAGQFSVLGLAGADVVISSGATLISGNVGLGPNDTGDLLKATITGTLFLDPTAKPDIHPDLKVNGGTVNQDLSAASAAAISASATLAALAPTQTYGNINSSTTFVGSGGVNVIALDSVNLVKGKIVIQGSASDVFVFNVKGGFNFSSSQMQLVGGVTFNNVLWNFPVSGTGDIDIFKDVTVAYGIFLAPNRNVTIDHTVTTGEVLAGGQIRIHSGATEGCPCP